MVMMIDKIILYSEESEGATLALHVDKYQTLTLSVKVKLIIIFYHTVKLRTFIDNNSKWT